MNSRSAVEINRGIPSQSRYVVLTFAGMPVVLPHTDVYTLEPRSDVRPGEGGDGIAGWIGVDGRNWPVVCLDGDLGLTTVVPVERRVCVLLRNHGGYAGVLCEAVATLEEEAVTVLSLPPALSAPGSPVRGLVLHGGLLGCLISSVDLLAVLPVSAGSSSLSSRDPLSVTEVYP